MAMLSNKTIMAALLTIAIASSLIALSGFADSAFAAKKGKVDRTANSDGSNDDLTTTPDSRTSNTRDSSGTTDNSTPTTPDTGGVSTKDLKTFSTCVSHDALDGRLNLAEVNDCYGQVFSQGFGHALDQSSSTLGKDLSSTGQGE